METKECILGESWSILEVEFAKEYMQRLHGFLQQEKDKGKIVYPCSNAVFRAFNTTPFEQVKVVILGQDPYHGPNQAMGLSFSVPKGLRLPPSLGNIYKEIHNDLGINRSMHGDLSSWAQQGVLLLNSVLTVEAGKALSHQGKGWEHFTDQVLQRLNEKNNIVFMLWGKYARDKGRFIDTTRHLVLEAAHPSPLSAYNGFFGCKHFSKANAYLQSCGIAPIEWSVG